MNKDSDKNGENASNVMCHHKWPSIELLHNVRKRIEALREFQPETYEVPTVRYRAKVKLDGTNGGVQVFPNGQVVSQSRGQLLGNGIDNVGFDQFVQANRNAFAALARPGRHLTLFGEWCGSGIQRGTAINQIGRKVFAIFGAREASGTEATLRVWPETLAELVPQHEDIYVLPWHGEVLTLDFGDLEGLKRGLDEINQWVLRVEASDPWVETTFGKSGVGEGLVLYPINGADDGNSETFMELAFKAKGEKHRVVKQKKAVQTDPEVAASAAAFVELFVTEARLNQAVVEACGGTVEMKGIGGFLRWIREDVKKESVDELEASGLTWRQVDKPVGTHARAWFLAKAREL